MRPVGRVGDVRSCGATILYTFQTSVFASGRLVAVVGSPDSHGGTALSTATATFVEGQLVTLLGDLNTGCYMPWPHTGAYPLVTGDNDVFGD